MGTFSKKSKDPTEIALSAIQDALSVRDGEERSTGRGTAPDTGADARRRGTRSPQALEDDLFLDPAGGPAGEELSHRAANDDRASIGQILQALQRRPSRTPTRPTPRTSRSPTTWRSFALASRRRCPRLTIFSPSTTRISKRCSKMGD
jgi:hypothetical protein